MGFVCLPNTLHRVVDGVRWAHACCWIVMRWFDFSRYLSRYSRFCFRGTNCQSASDSQAGQQAITE